MEFGSEFVYLGNEEEDYEEVKVSAVDDVALSDSDCSDDDGETCVLDILDTAGQEEFSSLRDQYVRTGDGFVIIYSITDKHSFLEAEKIFNWLQRIRKDRPYAILVANKQDLLDTYLHVTQEEGQGLAHSLEIPFYETSAKTGAGVQDAMHGLVRLIPRMRSDYKIVMLGAGAVGKSSVTFRFVSDSFVDDYDPTVEDSFRKIISVPGLTVVSKEKKKTYKKMTRNKAHSFTRLMVDTQCGHLTKKRRLSRTSSGKGRGKNSSTTDSLSDSCVPVKKISERKMDGNIVLIPLRNLASEPNIVTGEPITCKNCKAILTRTGKLKESGEFKTWVCEFCGEVNDNLDISEDEIPKDSEFDYMISPSIKPAVGEEAMTNATSEKKSTSGILVYCMDISSSMFELCHEPESHIAWREVKKRKGESISVVTRLGCIQNAIERMVEELKLEQPEKKVLVVVFSSNVEVKAGGGPVNFPRCELKFETFQELLNVGSNISLQYPLQCIEESHEAINAAVKSLTPRGCTALGPALSICLGFVRTVPGSEIILCTDGAPNEGIGSDGTGQFYEMAGKYARSRNITINILAMEGAPTELQHVSKAAEYSGGTTTKLNPVEIVRQLRLIAQNEVVATATTVRLYLPPEFVFDEPDFPENLSFLEKEVGLVKKEMDLTFKFKVKDSNMTKHIRTVPFQVQIDYIRPGGMQCLRVLSKSSEATCSRKDMEENINVSVIGVAAMQTTTKMVQVGKATEAQHMVKSCKRMVDRGAKDSKQREERVAFKNEVSKWDEHLTVHHKSLSKGKFGEKDADILDMTRKTNSMRQRATAGKMTEASKRKMSAKGKAAYYAHMSNI